MGKTVNTHINSYPSNRVQNSGLWVKLIYLVSCVVILFFMYADTLTYLMTRDWARDGYNYAYLMPFVIFYMLWCIRNDIKTKIGNGSAYCLLPVFLGCFFFLVGELGCEYFSLYLSFWLICIGITWSLLGKEVLITARYPLAMLLTLFPLPNLIYTNLTFKMQLVSSKLGVGLIHLFGMPAYREGNVIDMGFMQFQVVEACSGLHSLISLFVLSLIIIFFAQVGRFSKILIVGATIPLSIFSNSLRIFITSILSKKYGIEIAEGFYHKFSGILIFLFSFILLLILLAVLKKMDSCFSTIQESKKEKREIGKKQRNNNISVNQLWWSCVVFLLICSAAYVGSHEKDPVKVSYAPLSEFPMEIDAYYATRRLKLSEIYLESLDLDDYLLIDYYDEDKRIYNLYVAFYEQQKKGESIHSPATCLPGSGWEFSRLGKMRLGQDQSNNGYSEISKGKLQKGNLKQVTYYWFTQRGRILNNAFQLKFYNIIDSITMNRTDGALVRVMTPVYDNENERQTEKRLAEFVDKIMLLLNRYIPGKVIEKS